MKGLLAADGVSQRDRQLRSQSAHKFVAEESPPVDNAELRH